MSQVDLNRKVSSLQVEVLMSILSGGSFITFAGVLFYWAATTKVHHLQLEALVFGCICMLITTLSMVCVVLWLVDLSAYRRIQVQGFTQAR